MAETQDKPPSGNPHDPDATDPALLKRNSEIKSYTTTSFTYTGLRVFYKRHPQSDQLPSPPLPLLVFIHGLGGSVAQFHPLLTSLVHLSSCLAIDLPGCGRSEYSETSWAAYTPDALTELLEVIIDDYRQREPGRSVVLIGHSMGTALCARLASQTAPHKTDIVDHVVGVIEICPLSGMSEPQFSLIRKFVWVPEWLFNLWRAWDRRGGPNSASVKRFVGLQADPEAHILQDRYNTQSRTPVWRRTVAGLPPVFKNGVQVSGGMPTKEIWAGINVPVYLIAGENDTFTPPKEVAILEEYLSGKAPSRKASDAEPENSHEPIATAAAPVNTSLDPTDHLPESIDDLRDEDFTRDKSLVNEGDDPHADPSTPQESMASIPPQPRHPEKVVKSIILPAPANHAMMFTSSTVRILAGLISDFLASHVTGRLSLGWQLQYLSREGKWDVKNLTKWKNVTPVSGPIGPRAKPVFRAMKTLREADEVHCPAEFVNNWGAVIKDVVDISHDQPVYDPRSMEKAGVRYHKFPTVSKIPPTDTEIDAFITLVDRLREEQNARAEEEEWQQVDGKGQVIGVHCHYGFNRTGYFIVCYLVERCEYGVQQAIDAFAMARPNGIRHSHFLDRLFVRYSGLKQEGDGS